MPANLTMENGKLNEDSVARPDRRRQSKRKKNGIGGNTIHKQSTEDMDEGQSLNLGYVRLNDKDKSPIDKLLIKNGSVNDSLRHRPLKYVKSIETAFSEMVIRENARNETESASQEEEEAQSEVNGARYQQDDTELQNQMQLVANSNLGGEIFNVSDSQGHSLIAPQLEMGDELQNGINVKIEISEAEGNYEFNDDAASINSPSAVSVDSAIGSLFATESISKPFTVGDLCWGQIFNYCYWPCMVCPDPDGKSITTKSVSSIGKQHIMVHVRFFADKGRRNWIRSKNILPYTTLACYQDLLDECREKYGPKSAKFKQLVPKNNQVSLWREAVCEMQNVASVPPEKRLDVFFKICENTEAFRKQERHRRKSISQPSRPNSSIYVEEISDEPSENTNNLTVSGSLKRRRSVSPLDQTLSTVAEENPKESSMNMAEYKFWYDTLKEYVLEGHKSEVMEKNLHDVVCHIWALKKQNRKEIADQNDDNASTVTKSNFKFSKRLRALSLRKSLSTQDVEETGTDVAKIAEIEQADKLKKNTIVNRPILEVIDDIFELDKKYLFEGTTREAVCKYCFKPGSNIRKCFKNCGNWFHMDCITTQELERPELITSDGDVLCRQCAKLEPAKCIGCNLTAATQPVEQVIKCNISQCERAMHASCCKSWPQSKFTFSKNRIQSFRCPAHVCHTCVSDDPKGKFQHITNANITKCVKCPAAYHTDSTCIPAGSQILTSSHIICPRHSSLKSDMNVNVNWCFICVGGGQVVCCETCPTAVHAQCLKIPIDPNQGYICEECESGRMPLYGEMVWAKFNNFRWWPAIILPPTEIPTNIANKSHNPSDFVVRFFGSHNHGWISRRRVYLYVEGDSSVPPKAKSYLDQNYMRGVMEAKEIYEIVKAKKNKQRMANESKEKFDPQPYVRIKVNRAVPPVKLHVDIANVSKCECDPKDANPCGPESRCLNRVLYHECNPKVCPAGKRCQNQMFESRISPRMEVVYMKDRGFGLKAREPIAMGTFIIEYVGEVINDAECRARMYQKSLDRDENFYFLSVEKDYIIDAGSKGNLARFMNHSCEPNCETQKWTVNSLNRVGLFAIKNIPADEELTFNYHWDDLLGNEKKECYCGSLKCAGHIGGKIKGSSKEATPTSDIVKAKTNNNSKTKQKPAKRSSIGRRTRQPKQTEKDDDMLC